MGGHEARSHWEHVGLMMLIGGLLIGPFAWLLDLQISYASVKWACANNKRALLLALPIGSLALLAAGTWMSWSSWTKLRGDASNEGARMEDRSYFLAISGLALNALFALLILTSFVPRYFLSPCE
jgi:hypothetical protein